MKTALTCFCFSASLIMSGYTPRYLPFGQDPYFVGSNNSLLFLNPSFAGSNRGTRIQSNYRAFDFKSDHNYMAFGTSADFYLKSLRGAVFANFLADDVDKGIVKSYFLTVGYAQHLQLSAKTRIIPSFQVTYLTRSLNSANMHEFQTPDQRYGGQEINVILPSSNKYNFDASGGLLLESGNFYGGISVMHLNQPDIGFLGENRLPIRTNIHASYNFHCTETSLLNLSARYSAQNENKYGQLMATAVTFKHLVTGAGVGMFTYDYTPVLANVGYRSDFFTAGFIYEINTRSSGGQSFEVSLSYNLRDTDSRKTLTNIEAW